MKQKVQRDPNGVKYINPDRRCKDCKHYPCMLGQDKLKSDFARYGCTLYD